tara:strand:- start:8 stop:265 length:258 start_codon:yes stop_codon:yes gene_type:complete
MNDQKTPGISLSVINNAKPEGKNYTVHASGCRDIERDAKHFRPCEETEWEGIKSRRQLVEAFFDTETPDEFEEEFHFCNCCKSLK